MSKTRANLTSPDVVVRRETAERLAQDPEAAAREVLALLAAVADDDESTREWCVAALESVEAPASEQLPPLATCLVAEHTDVAYWAATLLGRAGESANGQQEALCHSLREATAISVRQRAAWALGKIGTLTVESTAALQEAAESADARLARLAQRALAV